jgi:hypothetical protein
LTVYGNEQPKRCIVIVEKVSSLNIFETDLCLYHPQVCCTVLLVYLRTTNNAERGREKPHAPAGGARRRRPAIDLPTHHNNITQTNTHQLQHRATFITPMGNKYKLFSGNLIIVGIGSIHNNEIFIFFINTHINLMTVARR